MENKTSKTAIFKQPLPKTKQEPKNKPLERKASLKNKNPPMVRQTLTSKYRLLKANPLLKYELEGKDINDLLTRKSSQSLPPNQILSGTNDSKSTLKIDINGSKSLLTTTKINAQTKNFIKSNIQNIHNKHDSIPKVKPLAKPIIKPNNGLRRSVSAQSFTRRLKTVDQSSQVVKSTTNISQAPKAPIQTNMSEIQKSFYTIPSTPNLPTKEDLNKRLNDWLTKRGKRLSTFDNLRSLVNSNKPLNEIIDEENKENVEVEDQGSYEDLKIEEADKFNQKVMAEDALVDLHKLITEGYPREQCEAWLALIRKNYKSLEEDPQYWECRAAIEQARGNISSAVECYKTAIVQGAQVQAVDKCLDQLLQKFSLLNINTDLETNNNDRKRVVKEARNIFKSSIIQFAIQEKAMKKKNSSTDTTRKYVATPVRRSTRLSRAAYTSTPGIQLFSSLNNIDKSVKDDLEFHHNNALL